MPNTVGPIAPSTRNEPLGFDLASTAHEQALAQIIRAYDSWVVRGYAWGRFRILRRRFLDEIGQYLPSEGRVLDIGCGFGLFSLYFATTRPALSLHGFDLSANRIEMARRAAARLGIANATYEVKDARQFDEHDRFAAAYLLDLIHHIPEAAAEPLLRSVTTSLEPGGVLLVKDVDTHPAYKRHFTRALDAVLDPQSPVSYWESRRLRALLESLGLRVYCHKMLDVLPYPHVLFICTKKG